MAEEPVTEIRTQLAAIERDFAAQLEAAGGALDALSELKSTFLGPKGRVTQLMKGLGKLSKEARPVAGKEANRVRQSIDARLGERVAAAEAELRRAELERDKLDLSLPGRRRAMGSAHPVNRVMETIVDIFGRMGFEVATGPEVELDWFNFTALNFPPDHPARDMQDTFFVDTPDDWEPGAVVLRTHTSPVQIRALSERGAPIRIVSPGRVYRCDSDASHSPMFHQIEGLWVDEGVSFAHLKGVLQSFVNALFGAREVRFRPSFFPFVEPGAEVDVSCVLCGGEGCRTCQQSGWMEILGAGMVHPKVLEACGVDSERYTGFAFGMGVDRVAMQKWHVDELKHFFGGDVRFLSQVRGG